MCYSLGQGRCKSMNHMDAPSVVRVITSHAITNLLINQMEDFAMEENKF